MQVHPNALYIGPEVESLEAAMRLYSTLEGCIEQRFGHAARVCHLSAESARMGYGQTPGEEVTLISVTTGNQINLINEHLLACVEFVIVNENSADIGLQMLRRCPNYKQLGFHALRGDVSFMTWHPNKEVN